MPRRKYRKRSEILPDPVYGSRLVARFINNIMKSGKKSVAERLFYRALEIVEKRTKEEPIAVFEKAIQNVIPALEVKSRRIGGATYQVPIEVRPERRYALAMRWIISFARSRKGKPFAESLAIELIDASGKAGAAVKKKEDTLRMAESNRAFSQFRW
ncbi:30S ribosomal protein S7 [bacterium]|nr:30S ribosomal protein S7 [bacterium]